MDENRQSILEYRLTAVEEKLEHSLVQINKKLDVLLLSIQSSQTEAAVEQERREAVKLRVDKLSNEIDTIKDTLTHIKVGLAEKFGPGAAAGAISATLVFAIKFFMGA